MAIEAHLDRASSEAGTPRDARRKLLLEAHGETPAGQATRVLVHDISTTGLLLETTAPLDEGEMLEIHLPHAGAVRTRVIWSSGRLFGCQFAEPIGAATLSAAQLRSATDETVRILGPQRNSSAERFGARLQRLRKDKGMTLAQVAAALGVSKPTVWAWEQDRAHPVSSRLGVLAETLGVARGELVEGENPDPLHDLIASAKERIAQAAGTHPDSVRIMIEL